MSEALPGGQLGSWLATGSEGAYKVTFATLLIAAALGSTYIESDGNFPPFELPGVVVRALTFSGVMFAVALVLPRGRRVSNAALALATLAGIFTSYVVHTELFYPANRAWMVTVLVASLIALFGAFRAIEELRWGGVALTVVAGTVFVAGVWPRLAAGLKAPDGLLHVGNPIMWIVLVLACISAVLALYVLSRVVHPSRTGWVALVAAASLLAIPVLATGMRFGEGGSGYYRDGWEDHPNVRPVAFKETPNLYFVGFDSITPEAIMRKHMGIETTRYHRLMERQMRRFPNLFANAVPTWFSFNTLMALDQDIYLEYRDLDHRPPKPAPSYFAGHDLSPLIWLLKLNGYETTSIYQNRYFGRSHGPNTDNYVVNDTRGVLCSLLDEDIRVLAFWGYCWGWASRLRDPGSAGDFLVQQLSGVDKTKPPVRGCTPESAGPRTEDLRLQEPRRQGSISGGFREEIQRRSDVLGADHRTPSDQRPRRNPVRLR